MISEGDLSRAAEISLFLLLIMGGLAYETAGHYYQKLRGAV